MSGTGKAYWSDPESTRSESEAVPWLPSRSRVIITGSMNKKRKATAEPGPIINGHEHKHIMHNGVSKFLKEGTMAKGRKYGWWPKMPLVSHFANPLMVTLEVGSEDSGIYKLYVHESILHKLDFFKAALEGGFKEASTKIIKMPEDDPVLMTSFVEFLYSGDYQVQAAALTELKDDGAHLKKLFTQKLYHARVLALAEKYTLEGLCNRAGSYMRLLHTNLEANATAEGNAYFLEYVVQLYEMSGPGSILRIPKTVNTASPPVTSPRPIVWNTGRAALWIGRMWRDKVQRHLVEEAFDRCPDLARDLLIIIADGFVGQLYAEYSARGIKSPIEALSISL